MLASFSQAIASMKGCLDAMYQEPEGTHAQPTLAARASCLSVGKAVFIRSPLLLLSFRRPGLVTVLGTVLSFLVPTSHFFLVLHHQRSFDDEQSQHNHIKYWCFNAQSS